MLCSVAAQTQLLVFLCLILFLYSGMTQRMLSCHSCHSEQLSSAKAKIQLSENLITIAWLERGIVYF